MNSLKYFIIFGSCFLIVLSHSTPCTTPNGDQATCVSLLSCPILLESTCKSPLAKKFIEASVCSEGSLQVCCGKFGNFIEKLNETQENIKSVNESNRDYVIRNKLLPTKTYCGLQHTDDYFYNKTETSVDEFPWLVYMVFNSVFQYNYYLRKETNCVGVLISNRYVLTSYLDCYGFISPAPYQHQETVINNMIFGQHHIYKDVSCIPTQFGVDDCTTPNLRGTADDSFAAPTRYTLPSPFGISIIRLNNKLDYSDFVRPICLPLEPDDVPKPGDVVTSSGWGEQQSVYTKSVKLKKRIKYDVMEKKECENGNPVLNPICGVPWENNTHFVCPGDNGGPLMYKHNNNWIVAGIVSKTQTCDDLHPVVAEGLTPEVIEWIFSAIVFLEKKAEEIRKRESL